MAEDNALDKADRSNTRDSYGKSKPRGARNSGVRPVLAHEELVSVVCNYLAQGFLPSQMKEILASRHNIKMSRETPYHLIAEAARKGWIQFKAPQAYQLRERVREKYRGQPRLEDVRVVQTAMSADVAANGAQLLVEILQDHYEGKTVHIGLSGGFAMHEFARRLSDLLYQKTPRLPKKIYFHAMVAGFDVDEPRTDPNAFFVYFAKDRLLQVDVSFCALHVPPMVEPDELIKLRKRPIIKDAYESVGDIDIVVTSTSQWKDEHSMLKRYIQLSGESTEPYERQGCVGDMLWLPLSANGPIEIEAKIRAMTLMDLHELSDFVARDKRVLLIAGPCGLCPHAPKTEVVRAILNQPRPLVTHAVIDSQCAAGLL